MRKNMKMLVAGGLVLTMAMGGSSAVFAEEASEPASASGGSYTIAMIPKIEGITFFSMAADGAMKAGEDLNVNVIYEGPSTPSASDQVALIEKFVEDGVDAICVSPNDMAEVGAALLSAQEAGVVVLDWDSQCGEAVTNASIYNVHDKEFGEHMVDKLVETMGKEGQYAIVTGGLDAANLNTWIDYGKRYAETEYPDLELVAIPIPSDEDEEKAYKVTKMLLESYPDLKGILGYSTPTAPGCARAIQEMGLQDQVALVANGMEVDCEEYRADGSLDCGCLWDVEKLGYLTIATAAYILDGKELDDSFAVEGIDTLTVSDNGHNVYYTEIGNDF